jgi:zinc transporter ZupT
MGKHNTVSGILVLVVILMIVISTYMVLNYATGVLNAAVAWASTDQVGKLQDCGITAPPELYKLRDDIPNLLLPAIYVYFPGLMVIISILMFISGYYYSGGEARSSSETSVTTSTPNRSRDTGKYQPGRRVEKTITEKSSSSEEK